MLDPALQNLLWIAFSNVPYLIAGLWGVILCYRRGDQRPHGLKWARAAIIVMVGGTVAAWLFGSMMSYGGQSWFASSMLFRWSMVALFQLPIPIAIGMLFWGIFGDVEPRDEVDHEPPVFRYDDGTAATK